MDNQKVLGRESMYLLTVDWENTLSRFNSSIKQKKERITIDMNCFLWDGMDTISIFDCEEKRIVSLLR